jgi:hypothetical protein
MKTFILIASVSALVAGPLVGDPDPAPAATATLQPRPEIERLQQEFEHRRAEALRPISAWYRGQLEILRKKLYLEAPGSEAKVAEVLQAAKEAFWQEDQPELKEEVVRSTWLWRSDYDPRGVAVTFRSDGTVEHIGLRGTWRISGPSEITVTPQDDDPYVLRLNTSLSAYEADQHNVSGVRMPATP